MYPTLYPTSKPCTPLPHFWVTFGVQSGRAQDFDFGIIIKKVLINKIKFLFWFWVRWVLGIIPGKFQVISWIISRLDEVKRRNHWALGVYCSVLDSRACRDVPYQISRSGTKPSGHSRLSKIFSFLIKKNFFCSKSLFFLFFIYFWDSKKKFLFEKFFFLFCPNMTYFESNCYYCIYRKYL